MKNILLLILALFFVLPTSAQEGVQEKKSDSTVRKQINIVYGANFTKDEINFPGAAIFSEDGRQVQFEHEGQVISKKVLGVEFFRTQFSERRDNIGILVSNISKIKGLKQSTLRGIISDIVE